jgi:hypothetical protein
VALLNEKRFRRSPAGAEYSRNKDRQKGIEVTSKAADRGEALTLADWKNLSRETIAVYHANEVEQDEIYYHVPCCHHYPSLFAWDSGFQAIVMSHIDAKKSGRELETLFAQLAPDGHLPHEVQLANTYSGRWIRGLETRLVSWEYDGKGASYMVDPPSYHLAVEILYRKTGDIDWLSRLWPAMTLSLDYLLEARDVLGNGLVTIFHPWESGTDLSPQFFQSLHLKPRGLLSDFKADYLPTLLYAFNHARRWDPDRLARADHFVCQDLVMNSLTARACRSMQYLAGEMRLHRDAERYRRSGARIIAAIEDSCWDEEAGCYFPLFGYRRQRRSQLLTAACMMPIVSGLCGSDRVSRVIEQHLLDPLSFWKEHGIPFSPEATIGEMGPWVENHLWSGHCIWSNICWMMAIGLGENGYRDEARELTRRVVRTVLREGFYEYYDSRTGEGRRIRDFTWPALALDMMFRFWPELVDKEKKDTGFAAEDASSSDQRDRAGF